MEDRGLREEARAHLAQRRFRPAAQAYGELIRRAPQDATLRLGHAEACVGLGDAKEAVSSYRIASELFARRGQGEPARQALELALELDPKNSGLRRALSTVDARSREEADLPTEAFVPTVDGGRLAGPSPTTRPTLPEVPAQHLIALSRPERRITPVGQRATGSAPAAAPPRIPELRGPTPDPIFPRRKTAELAAPRPPPAPPSRSEGTDDVITEPGVPRVRVGGPPGTEFRDPALPTKSPALTQELHRNQRRR